MTSSPFIIVADRAAMRAYRVTESAIQGPHLELKRALNFHDSGHKSAADYLPRQNQTATESEIDARMCADLANAIARMIGEEKVESWSFAAPASVHARIFDRLPPSIQNRVIEHVRADLVETTPDALVDHFPSLHSI